MFGDAGSGGSGHYIGRDDNVVCRSRHEHRVRVPRLGSSPAVPKPSRAAYRTRRLLRYPKEGERLSSVRGLAGRRSSMRRRRPAPEPPPPAAGRPRSAVMSTRRALAAPAPVEERRRRRRHRGHRRRGAHASKGPGSSSPNRKSAIFAWRRSSRRSAERAP